MAPLFITPALPPRQLSPRVGAAMPRSAAKGPQPPARPACPRRPGQPRTASLARQTQERRQPRRDHVVGQRRARTPPRHGRSLAIQAGRGGVDDDINAPCAQRPPQPTSGNAAEVRRRQARPPAPRPCRRVRLAMTIRAAGRRCDRPHGAAWSAAGTQQQHAPTGQRQARLTSMSRTRPMPSVLRARCVRPRGSGCWQRRRASLVWRCRQQPSEPGQGDVHAPPAARRWPTRARSRLARRRHR